MKHKPTLAEHLIQRGVHRQDELLAKIASENRTSATMKCVVSGRCAEFPLSVTIETATALGTVCVFPLALATVREWTDSLWIGSDKAGTQDKIKALEEQLARAELSVASGRQQEKVRLKRRKTAIAIQERMGAEATAAKARTQKKLDEADRQRKADENAMAVARRELSDPIALERTLQRRFTREQADTIRLYMAIPEAAQNKEVVELVLAALASRHFTSPQQRLYLEARLLEIKNGKTVKDGPPCAECGSASRLRYGRVGAFWGCTRYPVCRWLKDARADVEMAKNEKAVADTVAKREGRAS